MWIIHILICCFYILNYFACSSSYHETSPFSVHIVEESQPGTLIYGVTEYLQQFRSSSAPPSRKHQWKYQILNDEGLFNLFHLHPITGELRVATRIDRETLCPRQSIQPADTQYPFLTPATECSHLLHVLLTQKLDDSSHRQSNSPVRIPLRIIIEDVNDNAPSWSPRTSLKVDFVETPGTATLWMPSMIDQSSRINSQGNAKYAKTIERANDPDEGMNGTILYRLVGPGAEFFRLDDQSRSNGIRETSINQQVVKSSQVPLRIWPIVPLDRETEDFAGKGGFFNLTLLASDLGSPQKTGSIRLLINIIDVNDHSPLFHPNVYGSHAQNVGFELRSDQSIIYRPLNGILPETAPIGSLVLQLNATDLDIGLHGQIIYEFCPCDRNEAWDYFIIDKQTGSINVAKTLDYDEGPRQFQFKIIAKDAAPEPYTLTGTAMVELTLTDENDEPPQIHVMLVDPSPHKRQTVKVASTDGSRQSMHLGEYSTSIDEHPQPETVIAYIQVEDKDQNGQDQIHCRLGPTDNFTLQIDNLDRKHLESRLTNHLSLNRNSVNDLNRMEHRQNFRLVTGTGHQQMTTQLDREVTPTQMVTLTCTDSVGNAASVQLVVHLRDINDQEPTFVENGHFEFQLSENQELIDGKPIWLGRMVAMDSDLGVNAMITYSLEKDITFDQRSVDKLQRLFELDVQTGDLYAKAIFDRESTPPDGIYRFKVYAKDGGEPTLTGTATVHVYILDVNDWAPEFTNNFYTFTVPEDMRPQEIVGKVQAIDRDADSDGRIYYHIIAQSKPRRSKRGINREKIDEPNDTVRRTKKDSNYTQIGEIDFQDQNRRLSAPRDSSSPNNLKSAENINYFSIGRSTGEIRVIRQLDRESIAYFQLEVVATDYPPNSAIKQSRNMTNKYPHVKKSLTATATVAIAVTDVNDNTPIFSRPKTSTAIQLNLKETLGRQLLIIQADDADEGDNGRVTYHIRTEAPLPPNGPGSGYFSVDENTGILFLSKALNTSISHRLVIKACDHGIEGKRRCAISPAIHITVSDGPNEHYDGINEGKQDPVGAQFYPDGLSVNPVSAAAAAAQTTRRNEVVVVCLVVIFSVLLLATIFLVACLVHRRTSYFITHANLPRTHRKCKVLEKNPEIMVPQNSSNTWMGSPAHRFGQMDVSADSKLGVRETAIYNTRSIPQESQYILRDNMFPSGVTYSDQSLAYTSRGIKILPASHIVPYGPTFDQNIIEPVSPSRRYVQKIPIPDIMDNEDVRIAVNGNRHGVKADQTMKSKPENTPSPDYQSLDMMWEQFPNSSDQSDAKQFGRQCNPIFDEQLTLSECQPIPAHTYYEITSATPDLMWKKPALNDGDGLNNILDSNKRNFDRTATLGRPNTSKGKRRVTPTKQGSMYSTQAGELALHTRRELLNNGDVVREPRESNIKDEVDTPTYGNEYAPKGSYAFRNYQEGTFV